MDAVGAAELRDPPPHDGMRRHMKVGRNECHRARRDDKAHQIRRGRSRKSNKSEVEIHQTEKLADDRVEILPEDLAHATVDNQVERAGETHECVDDENNAKHGGDDTENSRLWPKSGPQH